MADSDRNHNIYIYRCITVTHVPPVTCPGGETQIEFIDLCRQPHPGPEWVYAYVCAPRHCGCGAPWAQACTRLWHRKLSQEMCQKWVKITVLGVFKAFPFEKGPKTAKIDLRSLSPLNFQKNLKSSQTGQIFYLESQGKKFDRFENF